MGAILIRQLDDAVIDALKARAARNRRSLQREAQQILEKAASNAGGKRSARSSRLHLKTVKVGGPVYSRETIYED